MKIRKFSPSLAGGMREPCGFALVATLMLMVLLGLLAIGMLSLSSITLRSVSRDSSLSMARGNARMALMLAIGELQKQMGPDQRISANAEIMDDPATPANEVIHPHWTGVWDSWKAGAEASGGDDTSEHSTIQGAANSGMAPTYVEHRADHFRTWLVSLGSDDAKQISSPSDVSLAILADADIKKSLPLPDSGTDSTLLVWKNSLGMASDPGAYVAAQLLPVESGSSVSGRYAWWVGDESQKARIMADTYGNDPASLTSADRIFRSQAPGSTGNTTVPGLGDMTDEKQLDGIPSLESLDFVSVSPAPPAGETSVSDKNFHDATIYSRGVLADVREGGLKRDLSTLLERPIDSDEKGDEFMLYKFNTKDGWANNKTAYPDLPDTPQEAVPIQDLAAYYQLYDKSRKGGIEYDSSIKVTSPDYGTKASYTLDQDYTTMYRQPIPIKVQFVLTLHSDEITDADSTSPENMSIPVKDEDNPQGDTHKLRLAVIPVVTLWNPNNVPLTMQSGAKCQSFRLKTPSFFIRCTKTRRTGEEYISKDLNLTFAATSSSVAKGWAEKRTDLMRLNFGYTGSAVTFAPGEVKLFSMPYGSMNNEYTFTGNNNSANGDPVNNIEATEGWNATGYLTLRNSVPYNGNKNLSTPTTDLKRDESNVVIENNGTPSNNSDDRYSLSLATGDKLGFEIFAEPASTKKNSADAPGKKNSPIGAALSFYMIQRDIAIDDFAYLNMRNYNLVTTMGTETTYPGVFVNKLISQGIPNGQQSYPIESISADEVINASGGATVPLMQFALMAGSEASEAIGDFAGRKFPMRPFLHSSVMNPSFIDDNSATGPYIHGWNWWFEDIGSILGALVNNTQTGNGYYGGGYTPEAGVNRVIQQEIPVTPPISIAALSHARLGGYTLASEVPAAHGETGAGEAEGYGASNPIGWLDDPSPTLGFQRVTATGQGGLYPHVLQAIGNSYAHPMLAPEKAYNENYQRTYHMVDGPREVTFADHSYLANKALWDEYFFSSVTPQKSTVQIFGGSNRTAQEVAQDFFFAEPSKPLPNRRILPYPAGLDQTTLNGLFTQTDYLDGLADKIAAYLMMDGSFNVNSTSVEAWKIFLSSLKGKPVAYMDGGSSPQEADTTGTPVGGLTLPTGAPVGAITDSKSPAEQWLGARELDEGEIDSLARAMVRQVKLRGPFLSLSEFVNRRLQAGNDGFSAKGALQAALDYPGEDPSDPDYPEVTINSAFRDDPDRMLDDEINSLSAADSAGFLFKAAAKGPVAYGSSTYVDQADVLRHLGSQLAARGDTFVIRTYGDALDADGNVLARAWCEAVVQRIPKYVDGTDENHLKHGSLSSPSNRQFGRKLIITRFRWLSSREI